MRRRDFLCRLAGTAAIPALGTEIVMAAPAMISRPIPSTGEAMPVIGLGTWQVFDVGPDPGPRQPLHQVLQNLVDAGGRMIDTSPMYGRAEAVTGDIVSEMNLRPRVFLATKVWTSGRGWTSNYKSAPLRKACR